MTTGAKTRRGTEMIPVNRSARHPFRRNTKTPMRTRFSTTVHTTVLLAANSERLGPRLPTTRVDNTTVM